MRSLYLIIVLMLVPGLAHGQQGGGGTEPLRQLDKGDLKVTLGSITQTKSGFLTITDAKVRAVEKAPSASTAQLQFRYRGPSKKTTAPNSNGTIKRQIGLKMRAKDTCNLLYVMWEIGRVQIQSNGARDHRSPEKIVILVKRNPGKKTHKSCGTDGYQTIAVVNQKDPTHGFASARDQKGHRLRAELYPKGRSGYELFVYADGKRVWDGIIPHRMLRDIDGPAGLRSDNGSFIFKFFAGGPTAP